MQAVGMQGVRPQAPVLVLLKAHEWAVWILQSYLEERDPEV